MIGPVKNDSSTAQSLSKHQLTLLSKLGSKYHQEEECLSSIERYRRNLTSEPIPTTCFQGLQWTRCEQYFPEINPTRAPREVLYYFKIIRLREEEKLARTKGERKTMLKNKESCERNQSRSNDSAKLIHSRLPGWIRQEHTTRSRFATSASLL